MDNGGSGKKVGQEENSLFFLIFIWHTVTQQKFNLTVFDTFNKYYIYINN